MPLNPLNISAPPTGSKSLPHPCIVLTYFGKTLNIVVCCFVQSQALVEIISTN